MSVKKSITRSETFQSLNFPKSSSPDNARVNSKVIQPHKINTFVSLTNKNKNKNNNNNYYNNKDGDFYDYKNANNKIDNDSFEQNDYMNLIEQAKEMIGSCAFFVKLYDFKVDYNYENEPLYYKAKRILAKQCKMKLINNEISKIYEDEVLEKMLSSRIEEIRKFEIDKIIIEKDEEIKKLCVKFQMLKEENKQYIENEENVIKLKLKSKNEQLLKQIVDDQNLIKNLESELSNIKSDFFELAKISKENEKNLENEINKLKVHSKSELSIQLSKALNHNKELINDNIILISENEMIKDQIKEKNEILISFGKKLQQIQNVISTDINDVYLLRERLINNTQELKLEKTSILKVKENLIESSLFRQRNSKHHSKITPSIDRLDTFSIRFFNEIYCIIERFDQQKDTLKMKKTNLFILDNKMDAINLILDSEIVKNE